MWLAGADTNNFSYHHMHIVSFLPAAWQRPSLRSTDDLTYFYKYNPTKERMARQGFVRVYETSNLFELL